MFRTLLMAAIALSVVTVLNGCQQKDAPNANTSTHTKTFHSANYPLGVKYDTELARVDGEASSYFDNGSWQLEDDAPGERLILLKLPESDDITTALWRLGASDDATAVDQCLTLPANAQAMSSKTTIARKAFSGFTLGDAAMSHFQNAEGYRAVVDGRCYAIDLIVQGINGDVYDPPRKAPFSREDAIERLRSINDGVSFDGE